MSTHLVWVVHCDGCECEDSEPFDTELEARLHAEAEGWQSGPGDDDNYCPSCADELDDDE